MAEGQGSSLDKNLVEDMMESGLVVKSPDKPKLVKAQRTVADHDRAKLTEMVLSLRKYKDLEEDFDDNISKEKSPVHGAKSNKNKDDKVLPKNCCLSDFVNSEMSVLTSALSVQTDAANKEADPDTKPEDSPKKSRAKVGSVCAEMQQEFISLQEQQQAKSNSAITNSLVVEDKVKQATPSPAASKSKESQDKGKGLAEPKDENVPKKKPNKKKGKKGNDSPDKENVGSYSQLLMTMGQKSPTPRQNKQGVDASASRKGGAEKNVHNKQGSPAGKKAAERTGSGVSNKSSVSMVTKSSVSTEIKSAVSVVSQATSSLDNIPQESPSQESQDSAGRKRKRKKDKMLENSSPATTNDKTKKDTVQAASPAEKKNEAQKHRAKAQVAEKYKSNDAKAQDSASGILERPDSVATKKKKKKDKSPSQQKSPLNVEDQERPGSAKQKNKKKGRQPQESPVTAANNPVTNTEPQVDTSTVLEVRVPKPEHMYVMGPQSRHLREIQEVTGVSISVPYHNSPSDMITLRGDKLQLGPAVAMMFAKSQQAQNEALARGARPKNPQQAHGYTNQGQGQNARKGQQQRGQQYQHQSNPAHLCEEIQNLAINVDPSGSRHIRGQLQGQGHNNDLQKSDQQNWRNSMGNYNAGQGQMKQRQGKPSPEQLQGQGYGKQGHTPQRELDKGQGQSAGKSQGRKQRKRQSVFADYMSTEEISAGLKRGHLVQGSVRINPKNYEEAYVPHPDGKSDILIGSFKHRNRALNGDIVVVQLLEEGEWKFNKDELQNFADGLKSDKNDDDEVLIESEETIEIRSTNANAIRVDAATNLTGAQTPPTTPILNQSMPQQTVTPKGGNQTPLGQSPTKGAYYSPRKRFATLNDVKQGESPILRKMAAEDDNKAFRYLLQRTGKVVGIIEKIHSRASTGHIKMCTDRRSDKALFAPNDHRMPRILIPMDNCPPTFIERPEDHMKNLYVCRVTDWRVDSMMAEGCLAKSLGEAGEIEPETEGMLIENGVDFDEFPQEVMDCLPTESPWCIPESEFEYRRDYRQSCVFTIDPATARDLDDALSCEELGDGRYKIGVHIADVSYFIDENTVLDRMAALRATSVYLVHKVIPMLPRLLCEQLCSLNPDQDRLTFSVEWIINEEGEIEDEWFGRSVIRSCVKLTYDHAQGFIEDPSRNWSTSELPPISEGFSVQDIQSRVVTLNKLAVSMRQARTDSGALRLDQVKLQYTLDKETGLPNGYWVYQQRDSNKLVEEFMLLANMAVAHKINSSFPDKAMLRRHPPPQEKMITNLTDQCSALGINLDTNSAGSLQRSLWSYYGNDDFAMARMQVLVALCSKPMQNAKYFCTGCIDDESLYRHYALNVPLYTHFTSPIRRFPDIIVHRLLAAALDYCKEPARSSDEIQKLAAHCNDKKTAAKTVGDLSSELFFSVFVKVAGPLEERAMVMGVMNQSFDIFVLKLGVSKRVYCDKLPLKEKIFRRELKVPSLVLVWESENGEPEVRQEITIFSVVDCVLQQGDLPLKWTAVIKRPQNTDMSQIFGAGMTFDADGNTYSDEEIENEETRLDQDEASLQQEVDFEATSLDTEKNSETSQVADDSQQVFESDNVLGKDA